MGRRIVKPLQGLPKVDPRRGGKDITNRLEAEKLFFKEGSKEARLVVKAIPVLRLLQRTETMLKSLAGATAEERQLIDELGKMLDYIEFG